MDSPGALVHRLGPMLAEMKSRESDILKQIEELKAVLLSVTRSQPASIQGAPTVVNNQSGDSTYIQAAAEILGNLSRITDNLNEILGNLQV